MESRVIPGKYGLVAQVKDQNKLLHSHASQFVVLCVWSALL